MFRKTIFFHLNLTDSRFHKLNLKEQIGQFIDETRNSFIILKNVCLSVTVEQAFFY